MKSASLLILSFIACLHSFAQTATCKPNKDTIFIDEPLTVEYKFDDQKAGNFQLENTPHFQVLNGPSTNSKFSSINGKTSSSIAYSYTFSASDTGNLQPPGGSFTFEGILFDVACPFVFVKADSMPDDYMEEQEYDMGDFYSLFDNFEKPEKRRFTPDIPDAYIQANVYLSARKFKVGQQFTVTCKTNAVGVEITKFSLSNNKFFSLVPGETDTGDKVITTKDNKMAEVNLIPLKPGKYRLTLFSIDTGARVIGTEPVLIKVSR